MGTIIDKHKVLSRKYFFFKNRRIIRFKYKKGIELMSKMLRENISNILPLKNWRLSHIFSLLYEKQ